MNSAQRALRGLPLPRQNGAEHTRVVLGVAASQLLQRCVLQAVLGRVKTVLGQFAVYSLPQTARGGDGQLVQAVVSAENQGVIAALSEDVSHLLSHDRVCHADSRGLHASRIRHGAQVVERGRNAQQAAGRAHVAHCRVEGHRKQERDAGLASALGDGGNGHVEADSEGFEDVCGAGFGGGGAVAVLDDGCTGSCDDEGGHGGDVDGVLLVAAGADDVYGVGVDVDGFGFGDHAGCERAEFFGGFALGVEGGEEGCEDWLFGLAGHDLVHGPGDFGVAEVLVLNQLVEDVFPGDFVRSHVLSVKPPSRICTVGCSMRDGGLLGVLRFSGGCLRFSGRSHRMRRSLLRWGCRWRSPAFRWCLRSRWWSRRGRVRSSCRQ